MLITTQGNLKTLASRNDMSVTKYAQIPLSVKEISNHPYSCKYVIRDYGDYKTISKICFINGQWDLASRVDAYIYWVNPHRPIE